MGLPLLNGFIGEFLILQGTFASNYAGFCVRRCSRSPVSSSAPPICLWLYQRLMFGKIDNPENEKLKDVTLAGTGDPDWPHGRVLHLHRRLPEAVPRPAPGSRCEAIMERIEGERTRRSRAGITGRDRGRGRGRRRLESGHRALPERRLVMAQTAGKNDRPAVSHSRPALRTSPRRWRSSFPVSRSGSRGVHRATISTSKLGTFPWLTIVFLLLRRSPPGSSTCSGPSESLRSGRRLSGPASDARPERGIDDPDCCHRPPEAGSRCGRSSWPPPEGRSWGPPILARHADGRRVFWPSSTSSALAWYFVRKA